MKSKLTGHFYIMSTHLINVINCCHSTLGMLINSVGCYHCTGASNTFTPKAITWVYWPFKTTVTTLMMTTAMSISTSSLTYAFLMWLTLFAAEECL